MNHCEASSFFFFRYKVTEIQKGKKNKNQPFHHISRSNLIWLKKSEKLENNVQKLVFFILMKEKVGQIL